MAQLLTEGTLVFVLQAADTLLEHIASKHPAVAVSEGHGTCVALIQLCMEAAVLQDCSYEGFENAGLLIGFAAMHLKPLPAKANGWSAAASSNAAGAAPVPLSKALGLHRLHPAQAAGLLRPVVHLLSAVVWQLMEVPGREQPPDDLSRPPDRQLNSLVTLYCSLVAAVVLPGE